MASIKSDFARIGGLLTGGTVDESVVRFAAAMARRSRAEFLLFQTAPRLTVPDTSAEDDTIRAWIAEEGSPTLAHRADIRRNPDTDLDQVLRLATSESLDLLVVGRRLPAAQNRSAAVYHRLARKVPCSMLVVSRHSRPRFERLVVSVDFSLHSALAVRGALALVEGGGADPVTCVHVLTVPYGYSYAGRTAEEFAAELQQGAEENFARFVEEHGFPRERLEIIFTLSEHPAEAVGDVAQARGADLVVVGSRGHSRAASVLLGSTTDALVGACAAPTLVVKQKGETAGLLSALLGI